jgi:hypothetical protein
MAKVRTGRQPDLLRAGNCLHALPRYVSSYPGWIVYDISENASTKMDEDLAK